MNVGGNYSFLKFCTFVVEILRNHDKNLTSKKLSVTFHFIDMLMFLLITNPEISENLLKSFSVIANLNWKRFADYCIVYQCMEGY